jgi:hypothetical protein
VEVVVEADDDPQAASTTAATPRAARAAVRRGENRAGLRAAVVVDFGELIMVLP